MAPCACQDYRYAGLSEHFRMMLSSHRTGQNSMSCLTHQCQAQTPAAIPSLLVMSMCSAYLDFPCCRRSSLDMISFTQLGRVRFLTIATFTSLLSMAPV